MGEVLLVLERVGLRQDAAAGVAKQVDPSEAESLPHGLGVADHVVDRVVGRVLYLCRPAAAALVDEYQPVRAGQRDKVGEEIVVRRPRSAVEDEQRRAASERLEVDE